MDPVWLAIAFILGFAVKQVGLPPLVGFLAAGFALQAFGVQSTDTLQAVANYGVMLLLFTIGLKLRLKSLLKPQVWAVASLHMVATVAIFAVALLALSFWAGSMFAGLDVPTALLVAFALSFSSTVFAVKVLEEKGEMGSLHGRMAIGVLIMQDLFAVIFITASAGKLPSPWALSLLGLLLLRPLLLLMMQRAGHGELLVLLGLLLPIAGGVLFERVGLKPDLGALVLGVLLAGHPKADELAKSLLSFKDLFLIGFFLTIGLSGGPSVQALAVAGLLLVLVPVKTALFFGLFTRFKLRARTATVAALSLSNYSEFGLIVGTVAVAGGGMSQAWLTVLALAVALTFALAAPLNATAEQLYRGTRHWLQRFETETRLPEDDYISPGNAEVLVFGMGRIGTGAYDTLQERFGHAVFGVDFDEETVARHQRAGRTVAQGDATDSDFWERMHLSGRVRLALLTMSHHPANLHAAERIAADSPEITIAAIAKHDDEIAELEAAGVRHVFNFYAETGAGFAEDVCKRLEET